jgi:hypothetical protein
LLFDAFSSIKAANLQSVSLLPDLGGKDIANLLISPLATFCKYLQSKRICGECKFQALGLVSKRYL